MDRLLAKDQILDNIYTLAYGLDNLDHASITSVFRADKPFTFDISSILGTPIKDITGEEYYKTACNGLGGFDATHHQLGCPIITFSSDEKAHVKVYVTALHDMETDGVRETVTGHAAWVCDVEKREGSWFITRLVVKLSAQNGDRSLMRKGHQRYEEGFRRGR